MRGLLGTSAHHLHAIPQAARFDRRRQQLRSPPGTVHQHELPFWPEVRQDQARQSRPRTQIEHSSTRVVSVVSHTPGIRRSMADMMGDRRITKSTDRSSALQGGPQARGPVRSDCGRRGEHPWVHRGRVSPHRDARTAR